MVHGFGIYDSEKFGKAKTNKLYGYWSRMIERCYSEKSLRRHTSYVGTTVCEDWKYYENFHTWAIENYIDESCTLDKDIIDGKSKIYSPETCSFVPHRVNNCIIDRRSNTQYPVGVWYKQPSKGMLNERTKPYCAEIVKNKKSHKLGHFCTPEEAHAAWQREKIIYLNEIIDEYKNIVSDKVINGLKRRIDMLQDDINNGRITKSINKV